MNLLAFDTSSSACTIALQTADQTWLSHQIAPMQQARLILPAIHELLHSAGLSLAALDAIIYGCGPGSFTGIRIASSVAQGLALAANKPVVPISSLAAIAQAAYIEHHMTHLLVAVDARMEEIYWAAYIVNQHGIAELVGIEQAIAPSEANLPAGNDWHAVGDGWVKYQATLITRLGFTPQSVYSAALPSAQALLNLATVKIAHGEYISAAAATPVYLR